MRRTVAILTGLLLLCGCNSQRVGETTRRTETPEITSPGLSGIGTVQIGKSFEEIRGDLVIWTEVSFPFSYLYFPIMTDPELYGVRADDLSLEYFPDLLEVVGTYRLTDGEDVDIMLDFYRDSLVSIDCRGNLVREALIAQYGEPEPDIWTGETATALYHRGGEEDKEGVEIYTTGRDIRGEVREYLFETRKTPGYKIRRTVGRIRRRFKL